MTTSELFFSSAYSFIVLMAALGAVLFFAVLLNAEKHYGKWTQPLLIPIIATGICLSSLLSGRNLQNIANDLTQGLEGADGDSSLLLRILTLMILGISLARISGQWLRKNNEPPAIGSAVFFSFSAYFISHTLLNGFLGTQPTFAHNILYSLAIFAAINASRRESLAQTISFAKIALFSLMALSLLAAVLMPNLAYESGYRGWIPGLSIRLWGVGSNANSIGPLALVALLLEYMQPYKKRWLHWLVSLVTVCVFILAQSKTVWFAAVVIVFVLAWYRMTKPKRGIDIRLLLLLIGVTSLALLSILFLDPISIIEKITRTKEGSQVATLTGRNQIWAVAINEWWNSPIFGYGPEIWGVAYRARIGMSFATSAHNQFLQSLSAAGLVGLVTLLIYLFLLGRNALRAAPNTKGVSAGLFLLVLMRCISETPLTLSTLFNGDLLTHILLFALCIGNNGGPIRDSTGKDFISNNEVNKKTWQPVS